MSQNLTPQLSSSSEDDEPRPPSVPAPKTPTTGGKRKLEGQKTQSVKKRSRRSGITKRNILLWELFEETDDKAVVMCKINPACKALIRRPDGSTSGMFSHLQSRHPIEHQIYLRKTKEALKEKVHFHKFLQSFTNFGKEITILISMTFVHNC